MIQGTLQAANEGKKKGKRKKTLDTICFEGMGGEERKGNNGIRFMRFGLDCEEGKKGIRFTYFFVSLLFV